MKTSIRISKRSFRHIKKDSRYKVIRRPVFHSGRVQPGHRIKRM